MFQKTKPAVYVPASQSLNPAMNVLVYSGKGTTTEGVRHTMELLRQFLSPYYAVTTVSEKALLNDPWMAKTSVLVLPGGADLPYCEVLNGNGNRKILQFVREGGRFLGFCAGGYYASARCEFEVGDIEMEVSGARELAFFPGTSKGCVYKGFVYESHVGARATALQVNVAELSQFGGPETVTTYYNGGGMFMDASSYRNVKILARYTGTTDVQDESRDMAAVVQCDVGKGKVLLSGVHPEYTPSLMKPTADDTHFQMVTRDLKLNDEARKQFFLALLQKVGLKVNLGVTSVPKITPMYISSFNDLPKAQQIWSNLQQNMDFVGLNKFEDANDTFVLHSESEHQSDYSTHEGLDDTLHEALVSADKHLIFLGSSLPESQSTPNFNMKEYFNALKNLYDHQDIAEKDRSFGSVLGYADVVTSTNTMLDANPNFLRYMPTGLTFTATTQIAGRGRGGNVWINPKGVMAASILFRISAGKQQSSSIVTLQYLCSLALIELILGYGSEVPGIGIGYEDMPIRLKWPNDIYALKPEHFENLENKNDTSSTVEGDEQKWAKISGALVNSQFINGQYYLVWGGGVNVLNEAPTTCLNSVLNKLNEIRKSKGLQQLPAYEHERLLARIVFTMGQFFDVFQRSGLKPFLSLYYKRWFHSNQRVKLEDHGSTRDCIIRGITPEYGLLIAQDTETKENLELQPDGNSFDIFKGLVYKKQG